MYGLKGCDEKGFHLYAFTDIDYVGEIVDEKYFDLENMSEEIKNKFELWYTSWKGKPYVFKDQLHYYCENDVTILHKACVKFSQIKHKTLSNFIYPFYNSKCMTIASLAMHIYSSVFFKEKHNWCIT